MALRKQGKCEDCGKDVYGDDYGAAGHKCEPGQDLIKIFDDLPSEPPKFSEERYFRLEEAFLIIVRMLEDGRSVGRNDAADFMHYIEFGEWK